MLQITIPENEFFNDSTGEFISIRKTTLRLEHSLLSLSKWEAKWHVPFLTEKEKTQEQCIDYIRCMTITPNVDPMVYLGLTKENFDAVNNYIDDPATATTIKETRKSRSREIVTSEIIYYWMVSLNIPFECEKWNLNRLIMLVRVCSIKNEPPKKANRRDLYVRNNMLNQQRRKMLNSTG